MVTLEEFIENVTQWGETRGIYAESTWQKQLEKWGEEYAEMLHSETTEELMDAVGDQAVCLIHCANLYDGPKKAASMFKGGFFSSGIEKMILGRDFMGAFYGLRIEMDELGVDFWACLNMAWDNIKDRKGLMVAGKFVKYENLNPMEKARCDVLQRDA